MKHVEPKSPVSFVVHVARLPQKGLPVVVEADERQRAAPCHRPRAAFRSRPTAPSFWWERWKRNGVKVSGRVEADITQACIVTLDPVERAYRRTGRGAASAGKIEAGARKASKAAGRSSWTPMGPTARRPFPVTSSISGRWPNSFSAWQSTLIRARPGPRYEAASDEQAGGKRIPEKAAFAARKILRAVRILEKLVVRQPQNSYFRRTFASPLILAGLAASRPP